MRRPSVFVAKDPEKEFRYGSRNWLLHARFVRGEHAMCLNLADDLLKNADNSHRYAHYVKGLVYADAGRHQEALERFHSCIRLQPSDPEPLKQVAKSLSCQGRYQLSLEAYLEADKLTKHPDSDIYCALAECASNLGQIERGVEWARAAVQAGGGERAGALLARLLLSSGDAVGASAAYDQAIATHACGADTLAAAGALRLRAGAPREAFQLLGAALAQQPSQHAAALALAAMMLQHRLAAARALRLRAGARRDSFQLLGAALAQQPSQHAAALAFAAMMLQHRLAAARALRLRAGARRDSFQLLGAALAQQPSQHAAALALAAMMLQHRLAAARALRLRAGARRDSFQLLGAALAQQPSQHAAALALAAMMLQHR
ncbi:Bardet-Biedl syndrome 4 protein homolog [Cydia pomonella]|uniref:Bardet-Biedl syndrome 4 protein homolog n=1 Tax=Cydia pomonella TaxID=82600 RepID=UPI002ADD4263|nr:Bardet-Biedl syndrome 4 protein homolog [Cydia pomonella]